VVGSFLVGGPPLGMGAVNVDGLAELNGMQLYDLKNTFSTYYGNDPNTNPYFELNISSNFYDPSSFSDSFANSSQPIYLNINIRSLHANHSALLNLVLNFQCSGVPIDIIAVQEIWQINYPETLSIPNFTFIYKQRASGRGGGVGFYINSRLNYKIREDLSLFTDRIYESLTLEITDKKNRFLITNIYRSLLSPLLFKLAMLSYANYLIT